MAMQKVTFTLPKSLFQRLKKFPAGKRTMLVKRVLEKELDRQAAVAIFKRMRGKTIWKKKYHADLLISDDFARYRRIKI
jgi:hypothetical protein